MRFIQNVTTENHRIMAILEALVILTLGSIGVSGNTGELSTTTGDTVFIPCDFGEGTIRNLYWYFNDGTGPVKILTLFEENVSVDAAYANRASLHGDSSTLILTDIMVKDEGTYRCDVDREAETAVPNINTILYVFSLTSHNLPEIAQCTEVASKSSVCNLYSKSITMNCALRNVYPAEDTELVWYRDEQRVHSTDNSKENDDGTVDITAEIEVSESGNLTCKATFLTAQGAKSTVMPVAVWITPVPEKGLSEGDIAGIAVGSVVFVTCLVIIIILLRKRKRKDLHTTQGDPENKANPEETRSLITLPDGNDARNQKGEETESSKQGNNGKNHQDQASNSSLPKASTGKQQGILDRSGKREITSGEITELANLSSEGKYSKLFNALGFDYNYHQKILKKHHKDYTAAAEELLEEWKAKTHGYIEVLDEALEIAELGGLIPKYKKVLEGSN